MATRATAAKAAVSVDATPASNVNHFEQLRQIGIETIDKIVLILFTLFGNEFASQKTQNGFDALTFWLSPDVKKTVYKAAATKTGETKRNKLVGAVVRLAQPLIDLGIRSKKEYKRALRGFNGNMGDMIEQAYAFTTCTSFVQSIVTCVALDASVHYHNLQSKVVGEFKPGEGHTVAAKRSALALAISQDIATSEQVMAAEKRLAKFRAEWQAAIAGLPEGATKAQKDAVKPALIPASELASPTTPTV